MADTRTPTYPTKKNGMMFSPEGVELVYGAPKITFDEGTFICQSCSKTQAGEIKEYNDEAGDTVVIVRKGDHREFSIEGLIDASVADKKQGEQFTLTLTLPDGSTQTYKPRVTSWQRSYGNEDVAKVSISARTYPKIDGGSSCDPEYADGATSGS